MPDPDNRRVVQYFENVGFYRLDSDPPDVAHLLAYGVWKCAQYCNYVSPTESLVSIQPTKEQPNPEIGKLDSNFTGLPITDIFVANDGNQEQIYEHVAIYFPPENPDAIALRPLPGQLGIKPELPDLANQDTGKFIAVEGNHGFYVPEHIDQYIGQHNGYTFVGYPITTYRKISDELYRQCFGNLCIDYRPNEASTLQIRPMSLGRRYKQEYYNQEEEQVVENDFQELTLTVWEIYPVIPASDTQAIWALVLDNGQPVDNIELVLTISLPDGSQQTINFPPTDSSGKTYLSIEPMETSNGTLIIYQVCAENIPTEIGCIFEDYLIWVE
jgi:hypothetical protein